MRRERTFSIRFNEDERLALQMRAEAQNRTVTGFIRHKLFPLGDPMVRGPLARTPSKPTFPDRD